MELTFVGTGASCAVPVIGHVNYSCACSDAIRHPDGPNRRNNVSMLLTLRQDVEPRALPFSADGMVHNRGSDLPVETADDAARVLIDCGKTFRAAYFSVLATKGISHVNALWLTHGHADAMNCVDDLCALHTEACHAFIRKRTAPPAIIGVSKECEMGAAEVPSYLLRIPTYLTPKTLDAVECASPALLQRSTVCGAAPLHPSAHLSGQMGKLLSPVLKVPSNVQAALDIYLLPEDHPTSFHVPALGSNFPTYTLPVEHGKGYISLGFVFGRGTAFKSHGATREQVDGKSCVVYISDVSDIPPSSMQFLLDLVKIDVLVFDLLEGKGRSSPPHTCWDDIMPYVRVLVPRKTYCVGMFCRLEHHTANRMWEGDLEREREAVVQEMGRSRGLASEEYTGYALMERFLKEVESIELAYDGLVVTLPA